MGNFGFQEILLIAVVILIFFGAKRIPEFMKGLGKGMREFNDAKDKAHSEITSSINANEPVQPATTAPAL